METRTENRVNVLDPECHEDGWPIGKKAAFFSLTIVLLLAILDGVDRYILTALLPFIKTDFGLSDGQLGLLVSIVNFSIALFVIPTAYLVDRWSRKKTMALMCGIWSIATGLCAFAGSYSHLLAGRFLVGAGEAGYNPAAQALLSAQFPKKFRSTVLALIQVSIGLGTPIGLSLGAWLAMNYGWRHALGVVAIPGLILAASALLIHDFKTQPHLKKAEPANSLAQNPNAPTAETRQTQKANPKATQTEPYLITLWGFLKVPSLLCVFFGAACLLCFSGATGGWLPMYFIRYADMTPMAAANVAAIMFFPTMFGFLLAGPVIDMFRKRFVNGTAIAMFIGVSFFTLGKIIGFAWLTPGSAVQIVVFFTSGIGITLATVGGPTMIMDLVPLKNRASAAGMLVACQNVLGLALGPLIAGVLSDAFSLETALLGMTIAPALAALCYLAAIFTFKRDIAKVECEEAVF